MTQSEAANIQNTKRAMIGIENGGKQENVPPLCILTEGKSTWDVR